MSKARSAIIWSAVDAFGQQGMAFGISIVLARLLTPEDFGTVGLLSLFIALAGVLANAGFTQALIQRKHITAVDQSTVFWFNLAAGAVLALLLCLIAPLFARVYNIPALEPLTYVMAANVFLAAAGSIQQTLLTKELNFKRLTHIGLAATALSGVVAIYLAMNGAGLWALAAQSIVMNVVLTGMLWLLSPWRPQGTFSFVALKSLFSFGGYMFASKIVDTAYMRGSTLLIGTLYGVRSLGFYQRALRSQEMPVQVLTHLVARVLFPLLSAVNDDPEQMRTIASRFIRQVMFITVPIMFGLAVVADLFIVILFGEKWAPAVPILSVLCFAGLFWPLQIIGSGLIKSVGLSEIFFRLELIKKSLGIGLIIIGSFFGVIGVAWAAVGLGAVSVVLHSYYTHKHLNFGLAIQVKNCMASLSSGAVMAGCVYALKLAVPIGGLTGFAFYVASGALIYFLVHLVVGRRIIGEALELARGT